GCKDCRTLEHSRVEIRSERYRTYPGISYKDPLDHRSPRDRSRRASSCILPVADWNSQRRALTSRLHRMRRKRTKATPPRWTTIDCSLAHTSVSYRTSCVHSL